LTAGVDPAAELQVDLATDMALIRLDIAFEKRSIERRNHGKSRRH
jgi:hypothetical protein